MRYLTALSISIFLLSFVPAQAQAPETECDRLAAHPLDPEKITDGVGFKDLDADRAIRACQAAVEQYPTELRLRFQRGRALQKAEVDSEAVASYRFAAKQGYAPAQVSLGMMYKKGRGVAQNYSEALKWYRLVRAKNDDNLPMALFLIGMSYHGQGHYKKSLEHYKRSMSSGYDDEAPLKNAMDRLKGDLIDDLSGRCLYKHRRDITNDTQKDIVETECLRQLENKSLERLIREYEKD